MEEQIKIRCPKLGHQVGFEYCMVEGGELPCPRIIGCWQIYMPVESILREKLTPSQWDRCFNQPLKEKMSTLIELIEAAKARHQSGG